jgi:TPR repeat protein
MKMVRAIGFPLLLLTVPCFAGDLEVGIRLYEHKQYTKAAIVFQRAAEHGNAEALRRLGFMYYHGHGVAQDNKRAVVFFEKSANAGDMQSASNLAKMYEFGMGVEQDDARAAEWYRRAAELGDPVSQFGASIMYYKGQGVPRDRVEAVKWWTLAMMHGAEWAHWTEAIRPTVESAQGKLTAEEIAQGRDRAELWSKAHVKSN